MQRGLLLKTADLKQCVVYESRCPSPTVNSRHMMVISYLIMPTRGTMMAGQIFSWALALLSSTPLVSAAYNCPMFGREFPFPQNLDKDPVFMSALQNLTGVVAAYDASVAGTSNEFSYSLQIYSTNPGPEILWERFHTASNLPSFDSPGVTTVDRDSVYRLGSVTKVYTVFSFLAQDGDRHFNDPITKYVPELAAISEAQRQSTDPLTVVDWEDVTIGALASQMAGIVRDCKCGILGHPAVPCVAILTSYPLPRWSPG
jgi:hypothetical protein